MDWQTVTTTVFKVNATSEADAKERVTDWMDEYYRLPGYWDSYRVNGQSANVRTDADFEKLRAQEIEQAGAWLRKAMEEPHVEMKGRHLFNAAGLFVPDEIGAIYRLVHDLTCGDEPEDDE